MSEYLNRGRLGNYLIKAAFKPSACGRGRLWAGSAEWELSQERSAEGFSTTVAASFKTLSNFSVATMRFLTRFFFKSYNSSC